MKKTFFQKTYNLISYLFFFGVTSFILSFVLNLLVKLFGNLDIPFLSNIIILIQDKLNLLENYTKQIATILMLTAVSLIVIELTHRIISDNILNYFKSVYQTIRLRQFLWQDEKSESVITIDNQTTVTKFNPILRNFNQTTKNQRWILKKTRLSFLLNTLEPSKLKNFCETWRNISKKKLLAVIQTIIFLRLIGKVINSGSRLQEDKKRAVLGSQSESQKHCLFNLSNLIMSWGYYDPHDTNNQ